MRYDYNDSKLRCYDEYDTSYDACNREYAVTYGRENRKRKAFRYLGVLR